MLVVGLTGGIASGKSTVSSLLQQMGVPVICADELAHEAVKPGAPALEEIRREFGDETIDEEGNLDRAAMARLVFHDPALRRKLESIIHPRVSEGKNKRLAVFRGQGHDVAVVDVPLLYESGWEKAFDLVVVVYVTRDVQERRLVERDGMSLDEAHARLEAQMPIDEKRDRADKLVDNTGSLQRTREQVESLLKELRIMAGRKTGNPGI
ncbi:MAG: dephospho-CoA kinase [Pseudomonadota bacterium]